MFKLVRSNAQFFCRGCRHIQLINYLLFVPSLVSSPKINIVVIKGFTVPNAVVQRPALARQQWVVGNEAVLNTRPNREYQYTEHTLTRPKCQKNIRE